MAKHIETGKKGEALAVDYLKEKGYQLLETNWRFSKAEIDIIMMDDEVLVFIEVKTRSYDYYGKPEESVTEKKQHLLADAAKVYMTKINHEWEIRFDVVAIVLGEPNGIEHFEDAFFPGL